jgi:pimeloyl-ACP methyl ester carboxylesterase
MRAVTLWGRPLAAALVVAAQAQPPAPRPALQPTRSDLAFAYLDLERALTAAEPKGDDLARVNRDFDSASRAFLRGGMADALRGINDLTASLSSDPAAAARPASIARSLQVRIDPPVLVRDGRAPLALAARVGAMYSVEAEDGTPWVAPPPQPDTTWLTLAAYREAGDPAEPARASVRAFYTEFAFPTGGAADASVTLDLAPGLSPDAPEGAYTVVLVAPGLTRRLGRWTISDRSIDAVREANAAAIDALGTVRPDLRPAVEIVRARNNLLSDRPGLDDSARFLADLPHLAREVESEIARLAEGHNPYAGRRGDWWMAFDVESVSVPARVYCPQAVGAATAAGGKKNPPVSAPPSPGPITPAPPTSAPPLVIVLHGAGGDESLFMDGYGLGVIKSLADRHGLIVVSPRCTPFLATPAAFDAIVGQVAALYPLDRERIYVIGHSLGGGVAAAWARLRRDKVAAACAIAGISSFRPGEPIAPFLAVAAELDSLSPIAQARRRSEEALQELVDHGRSPVEFRRIEYQGHTLVVGACLGEVVDWLLGRRLSDRDAGAPQEQPPTRPAEPG